MLQAKLKQNDQVEGPRRSWLAFAWATIYWPHRSSCRMLRERACANVNGRLNLDHLPKVILPRRQTVARYTVVDFQLCNQSFGRAHETRASGRLGGPS